MIKSFDIIDEGFFDLALNLVDTSATNILDIGCGSGKTVFKLASKFNNSVVYGMDYSYDAVDVSKKRNKDFIERKKVQIIQGSLEEIPFRDNLFDYVFAIRTHYFWNNLDSSFREIFRKLKAGGIL